MIPVDAVIWKEGDVRREAVSVESVLDAAREFGASAKIVVLDEPDDKLDRAVLDAYLRLRSRRRI